MTLVHFLCRRGFAIYLSASVFDDAIHPNPNAICPLPKMSRAEELWERLVRAALRRERTGDDAYGQPVGGIAGNVPSALAKNRDIDEILRVADEIEDDDPNISRILCEHAYSLSQNLDPNSEGRGVLQFKTGLMSVIKQKLAKREAGTIDRSQDIARLQEFYKSYREKHNVDKLREEEMKLRESGAFSRDLGELERKTVKRKRVFATLKVLGTVLEQLSEEIPDELKRVMDSDSALTEDLVAYNIIPLDASSSTNAIVYFPEVQAAVSALKYFNGLPELPRGYFLQPTRNANMFDFLQCTFGFQKDNVANQHEHIVHLLANEQSRLRIPEGAEPKLDEVAVQEIFLKSLQNYIKWCDYLGIQPVWSSLEAVSKEKKLLYVSLYFLIWGEASNIRFLPECLCYIYHHMAREMDEILRQQIAQPANSCTYDSKDGVSFLDNVIFPLYDIVSAEAANNDNGKAPHSSWRNYDDFNESLRCFELSWPWRKTSSFFQKPLPRSKRMLISGSSRHQGKTSFVEHRTFFHLYHSFHRLWIFLFMMFQGLTILAFNDGKFNAKTLREILSLGPTFVVMKLFESVLDIFMMYGAYSTTRRLAVSRIFLRFLWFSLASVFITFLYVKALQEESKSNGNSVVFRLYVIVIGIYAGVQFFISFLMRIPACHRLTNQCGRWPLVHFVKWLRQERHYVGRGMYERSSDFIKYMLFWLVILSGKFAFAYFLQIRPLVKPTKAIIIADNINYSWHDFVSKNNHNALTVVSVWAPVVAIYLLDIYVFYTLVSAVYGFLLGARDRLGEVVENSKADAARFAPFWNEIIRNLREEDYVTNFEMELLLMPRNSGDLPLVQWPLFLLASKIFLARDIAVESKDTQDELWDRISRDDYMMYAVQECYYTIKFILTEILDDVGRKWVERIYDDINASITKRSIDGDFKLIRGMMYYRKALMLQTYLERTTAGGCDEVTNTHGFELSPEARAQADLKFTYVVTCQIYGKQKEEQKPEAADIALLMQRNEALRVAFIDVVETLKEGKVNTEYYSKLVKADINGKDKEIYSVKLPGNPKLGEGKPENQNHAIIFTRGNAVQTIDMNQDNYFEEALKMRNLLEEFHSDHGLRPPTILGVREHVFTGSVSSLASFMSNQETSFVTLGQRVLANPLKVRMHYGHPDVFDRIFHITRGGISKASRVINISEDIYSGFNSTLRQGNITHHEYIQVGKGRDVGLNQIALFEGKVSGGNGEQVLSRDVYRLGQLFDFFRMLSFYFTTVGYYFCTMLTVLTVYAFLYGKAYLALSGVGEILEERARINKNTALSAALNTQFLFQIGIFTAVPMILGFILEQGFLKAIVSFVTMQFQLCTVFFTFSLGTRTHYFGRTILHGGARYQATGRGFVVRHIKFSENYRLYSRSHFVKGLEVALLLIVYLAYGYNEGGALSYILLSISSWFMALSWLFAPYLFNPSGFEWQKVVEDFRDWTNWLLYRGGIGVKGEESWEAWWEEELAHIRSLGSRIAETILSLRFFIFQYGIVYKLNVKGTSTSLTVYGLSWVVLAVLIILFKVFTFSQKISVNFQLLLRFIQGISLLVALAGLVVAVILTELSLPDIFASMLAFIPTGWGILSIAAAWKPVMKRFGLWKSVRSIARLYDAGMGMLIFVPIAFFSWFPFVSTFQTRLMFNQAFSRGLEISLILAGNNHNTGI
ncbi:Callose synthase 9 [Glycine soja]